MKSSLAGRRKESGDDQSTDRVIICFMLNGNPTKYTMPVPLSRAAAQAYLDTYVSHLPNYTYWLEPARGIAPQPVEELAVAEDEQGHLFLQMGPVDDLA